MATPLALPPDRVVGDYRLRSGHQVRFRPDPVGGGWRVDLWSLAGALILAGEPLVVSSDLWAQYRASGAGFPEAALEVTGADPSEAEGLGVQDLTLRELAA